MADDEQELTAKVEALNVSSTDETQPPEATTAVADAKQTTENDGKDAKSELERILDAINNSSDRVRQFDGTRELRSMLSTPNPPISEVVQTGVVSTLLDFIRAEDDGTVLEEGAGANCKLPLLENLQFEAMWAITNVASGDTEHVHFVIQAGCVPPLIKMISHRSCNVQEQAVWAIGNIAGENAKCRDYCLQQGALPPMLAVIRQCLSAESNTKAPIVNLWKNAVWALSNLFRGKPQPPLSAVAEAFPVLRDLLEAHSVPDVVQDALWALSYATDGEEERIERALASGFLPPTIAVLLSSSGSLVTPALRAIGNVVAGTENQTQRALDCPHLLPSLGVCFSNPKNSVRKEAAWTLSNITAGSEGQIQAVLDCPGLLDRLVETAIGDTASEVKKECLWALSNMTTSMTLPQLEGIRQDPKAPRFALAFAANLTVADVKLVAVALEGIDRVLRLGQQAPTEDERNPWCDIFEEHLDSLETLQRHSDDGIYDRATRILETYFEVEEAEAE